MKETRKRKINVFVRIVSKNATTFISTHTHTYIYLATRQTHICMYVCMYIFMHVCIYVCVCAYDGACMCTYTHTHIRTLFYHKKRIVLKSRSCLNMPVITDCHLFFKGVFPRRNEGHDINERRALSEDDWKSDGAVVLRHQSRQPHVQLQRLVHR